MVASISDINKFNDLTRHSNVFVDIDTVFMELYRQIRQFNYTQIILKKYHPLDISLETYLTDKKVKKLVDDLIIDNGVRFWQGILKTSVSQFYWKRLEAFQDRIRFITRSRCEAETKGKIWWVEKNYPKIGVEKLHFLTNFGDFSSLGGYPNVLITGNKVELKRWENAGGVGLIDLAKRSVSSYHITKSIIPHLEEHSGRIAVLPPPTKCIYNAPKHKDITLITFEEANVLPEHVKIM